MVGRKLPATTLGRCIVVELRRRRDDEQIVKFGHEDDSELTDLRSRLRRWQIDNESALRGCAPKMPNTFVNRRADNWRVQFAIADLCSGVDDWGDKARMAAIKIERASDATTSGVRLLAAIRIILGETNGVVGSQQLIDRLSADLDSEWAEWGKSRKPISQAQLARLLKAFHILPGPVRIGGQQVRGYQVSQFEDAFATYLPSPSSPEI
jgi:hypothetical protein